MIRLYAVEENLTVEDLKNLAELLSSIYEISIKRIRNKKGTNIIVFELEPKEKDWMVI